jgi:hypothetical protein
MGLCWTHMVDALAGLFDVDTWFCWLGRMESVCTLIRSIPVPVFERGAGGAD